MRYLLPKSFQALGVAQTAVLPHFVDFKASWNFGNIFVGDIRGKILKDNYG